MGLVVTSNTTPHYFKKRDLNISDICNAFRSVEFLSKSDNICSKSVRDIETIPESPPEELGGFIAVLVGGAVPWPTAGLA
jgi:hypothetical protein